MKIAEFPIKKPVTVIMMMLIIVVLGGISLSRLAVDILPKITFPNLSVVTTYSGVAPEEIEKIVTRPLEETIKSISNVVNVTSTSSEGMSVINVEFDWTTNLDEASNSLRDRIGAIANYLPDEVSTPLVVKMNMSMIPVMFAAVSGDRDLASLHKITENDILPKFERINGVAAVYMIGGKRREIQVEIDKDKLSEYGLGLDNIINKLRYENLNVSGGSIEKDRMEFFVRSMGEFKSIEEISNVVVGTRAGNLCLKDIAKITDGYAEREGFSRLNGRESIGLFFSRQTDFNMVKIAEEIYKEIPAIKSRLPKDLDITVVFDVSKVIKDSINSLTRSSIEGGILAIILIFAFLWNWRPTVVIAFSIPLSILTAFVCMYFQGLSINIMSLGGISLALGRLVDDAIVVLENIFRHHSLGKTRFHAAVDGLSEVALPVTASTIVTVAVFFPIVFVSGIAGQLFKDFAATVFYCLMASLLIAFTLIPMLSSRILKEKADDANSRKDGFFEKVKLFYAKILLWCLDHKKTIAGLSLVLIAITLVIIVKIPKEFMPSMSAGMMRSELKMPVGTALSETDRVVGYIENHLTKIPDIKNVLAIVGSTESSGRQAARAGSGRGKNNAEFLISLVDNNKRKVKDQYIFDILKNGEKYEPKAKISAEHSSSFILGSQGAIDIKILGKDFEVLKELSEKIKKEISKIKGISDVKTSLDEGNPELKITFDRSKLANYGLTAGMVSQSIKNAIQGAVPSTFKQAGEEIDILVVFEKQDKATIESILDIPVTSVTGVTVPLRDIAKVWEGKGYGNIKRENSARIVTVSASFKGSVLSIVSGKVDKILEKIKFPEGYFYSFGGEREDMMESFKNLGIMLVLAILLVYMLIASLYESLIHPLTIMLSVPFAFTGAFIALYITNTPLGVTSYIGMIMLVGIVATNAIVLIDFIIKLRAQGMARREAIIEGGKTRLRPILMTAIATMFALIPIALGLGESTEMQVPMGIAVIGGLFSSTLLTLIIVPIVYEVFDKIGEFLKGKFSRKINIQQEGEKA